MCSVTTLPSTSPCRVVTSFFVSFVDNDESGAKNTKRVKIPNGQIIFIFQTSKVGLLYFASLRGCWMVVLLRLSATANRTSATQLEREASSTRPSQPKYKAGNGAVQSRPRKQSQRKMQWRFTNGLYNCNIWRSKNASAILFFAIFHSRSLFPFFHTLTWESPFLNHGCFPPFLTFGAHCSINTQLILTYGTAVKQLVHYLTQDWKRCVKEYNASRWLSPRFWSMKIGPYKDVAHLYKSYGDFRLK